MFDPSISSCSGTNCSSETVNGTRGSLGAAASALPWVIEIFSFAQRCLRLDITAQDTDLEMVLVAPDGTVFRNDDGGTCSLCPLVKVASTSDRGWYTLQVSQFAGNGNFANFTLRYGSYPRGNANCASPTRAQSVRDRLKTETVDPFGSGDAFDPDAAPPTE